MARRFAVLSFFILTLPVLARGSPGKDEPDAIRNVLEMNLTRAQAEELSGTEVTEFRLYVSPTRSVIAWWRERTLYVYPITDSGHEARAAALVELLRQHGLTSFVAERKSSRIEGFNQVSLVKAFQVAAPLGSGGGV